MIMQDVLADVAEERRKQDRKWGVTNHTPSAYLVLIMEELGEAAEVVAQAGIDPIDVRPAEWEERFRKELIQVAAIAVAAIETLDRNRA